MLTSKILERISFFDTPPSIETQSLEEGMEVIDDGASSRDADLRLLSFFFEGFLNPDRIVKLFRSETGEDGYRGILVLNDDITKITISATTINGPWIQIVINDHGKSFSDKESLIKACHDFEEGALKTGIIRLSKRGYSFLQGKDHIYNLTITGQDDGL